MDLANEEDPSRCSKRTGTSRRPTSRARWKYFFTVTNVDGTPQRRASPTRKAQGGRRCRAPPGRRLVADRASRSTDRYLAATLRERRAPAHRRTCIDLKDGKARSSSTSLPGVAARPRDGRPASRCASRRFDGKKVPAFVYTPHGDGPFPGGHRRARRADGAVARATSTRIRQYLVSQGLRRARAQRARLDRLRQVVHQARQPRPRRRSAQGHRGLQEVAGRSTPTSIRRASSCSAAATAATWRSPPRPSRRTSSPPTSTTSASRT